MTKHQIRVGALCLLAYCVVAAQAQSPAPAPAQTPVFAPGPIAAAEIDALRKQFNVPGVSVAVIKDFKIEWAKGYGVADVETNTPVTTDTISSTTNTSSRTRIIHRARPSTPPKPSIPAARAINSSRMMVRSMACLGCAGR